MVTLLHLVSTVVCSWPHGTVVVVDSYDNADYYAHSYSSHIPWVSADSQMWYCAMNSSRLKGKKERKGGKLNLFCLWRPNCHRISVGGRVKPLDELSFCLWRAQGKSCPRLKDCGEWAFDTRGWAKRTNLTIFLLSRWYLALVRLWISCTTTIKWLNLLILQSTDDVSDITALTANTAMS